MRKILVILLASLLMITLLGGCGSDEKPSQDNSNTAQNDSADLEGLEDALSALADR